jgi:hypothetical protein
MRSAIGPSGTLSASAFWAMGFMAPPLLAGIRPGWLDLFGHVPLFSARTDPASLRAAHPLARILMYLGGPLFTGLTSVGIPLYGRASGVHRARALLIGVTLRLIPGSVVECIRPGGDLRRAFRELRRITDHSK